MVLQGFRRVFRVYKGLDWFKGFRRALGFQIKLGNPETGRRCKHKCFESAFGKQICLKRAGFGV